MKKEKKDKNKDKNRRNTSPMGTPYILLETGGVRATADCTIEIDRGLMLYFSVPGDNAFAEMLRETREYCFTVMDSANRYVLSSGRSIDIPCGQSLETAYGGRIYFEQPCTLSPEDGER
jgi:hypothetical protein